MIWWFLRVVDKTNRQGNDVFFFFIDFFFGLFLKKLHTSSETNNNLNTMQFPYVQNPGLETQFNLYSIYIVFFTQPSSVKLEHGALLYKDKLCTDTWEATGKSNRFGDRQTRGKEVTYGDRRTQEGLDTPLIEAHATIFIRQIAVHVRKRGRDRGLRHTHGHAAQCL